MLEHEWIVRVDDRHGVTRETEQKLPLRVGDLRDRIEELEVHFGDVGEHTYVGLRNLGEPGDFTGLGHTHLENGDVLVAKLQNRQRQAVEVVQVSLGFQDPTTRTHGSGGGFFRRRLPHASGDRDDTKPSALAHNLCEVLKRPSRVLHLHLKCRALDLDRL